MLEKTLVIMCVLIILYAKYRLIRKVFRDLEREDIMQYHEYRRRMQANDRY